MIPTTHITMFLLVLGSAGVFGGNGPVKSVDQSEAPWIARVGGHVIPLDVYVRRYADFIMANGMRDNLAVRQAILRNMINEHLLRFFDSSAEVLKNPNYRNEVERAEKRTVLAYLKDREIYANISVDDHELRIAFQRANERLSARHLYARTEEEAGNLYELLKIGVDFDYLAGQVFTDSVLQANGGYLGYFSWGDMDPAFEEAAYSLSVGEISPPVKTEHGFSIIRLEDRVSHPLLTETQFLQKKSHLMRVLKIRKKKPAEEEYVRRVFNREKVVFDDSQLVGLLDGLSGFKSKNPESSTADSNPVCARYQNRKYRRNDILRRLNALPMNVFRQIVSSEKLKSAINGIILQEELLSIAAKKGYDKDPAVVEAFGKAQESLFLKYKIREITEAARLSDSTVFDYYRLHPKVFSTEDEINVQEIIVEGTGLADSLEKAIKGGSDFGELAERYSLRKWTARNKGVMGLAPLSRFGQLKGKLWESNQGDLVGPVVIGGYSCFFRVLQKKDGEPLPFDAVRERAVSMLKFEKQQSIVRGYLAALESKVRVEIDEPRLSAFRIDDFVPKLEVPSSQANAFERRSR